MKGLFLWAWGLNYVHRDTLTYINYKSLAPSSGVDENFHSFLTFASNFRDNEKLNISVT